MLLDAGLDPIEMLGSKKVNFKLEFRNNKLRNRAVMGVKYVIFCSCPHMPPFYICLSVFILENEKLSLLDLGCLRHCVSVVRKPREVTFAVNIWFYYCSIWELQPRCDLHSKTNPALKTWRSVSSSVGG